MPGCATGEEVYSIAMTLMEYLGDRSHAYRIQIFGSDVSEGAIEKARAGLFLNTIVDEVSPERLERFFTKEDSHYRIARGLRDLCIFSRQDVTRDPPFSRLDLVSCRNLLIYLDAAAQRRVMQVFHYALRPTGFLMLGPKVWARPRTCSSCSISPIGPTRAKAYRAIRYILSRERVSPRSEFSNPILQQNPVSRRRRGRRVQPIDCCCRSMPPASILVDEALNILQIRGETGRYLEFASGAPSLNLNRVARPELLIEISPALAEAHETGSRVRREGLRVDDLTDITLQVIPLKVDILEPSYLVILEDASRRPSGPASASPPLHCRNRRKTGVLHNWNARWWPRGNTCKRCWRSMSRSKRN